MHILLYMGSYRSLNGLPLQNGTRFNGQNTYQRLRERNLNIYLEKLLTLIMVREYLYSLIVTDCTESDWFVVDVFTATKEIEP